MFCIRFVGIQFDCAIQVGAFFKYKVGTQMNPQFVHLGPQFGVFGSLGCRVNRLFADFFYNDLTLNSYLRYLKRAARFQS